MSLTTEQVQHVARLARLRLAPEELETMREQLSNILDHFEMLQELDVRDIPPTAQVGDLLNVLRADQLRPSLARDAALANAPDQQDGMFRVKAVLD